MRLFLCDRTRSFIRGQNEHIILSAYSRVLMFRYIVFTTEVLMINAPNIAPIIAVHVLTIQALDLFLMVRSKHSISTCLIRMWFH